MQLIKTEHRQRQARHQQGENAQHPRVLQPGRQAFARQAGRHAQRRVDDGHAQRIRQRQQQAARAADLGTITNDDRGQNRHHRQHARGKRQPQAQQHEQGHDDEQLAAFQRRFDLAQLVLRGRRACRHRNRRYRLGRADDVRLGNAQHGHARRSLRLRPVDGRRVDCRRGRQGKLRRHAARRHALATAAAHQLGRGILRRIAQALVGTALPRRLQGEGASGLHGNGDGERLAERFHVLLESIVKLDLASRIHGRAQLGAHGVELEALMVHIVTIGNHIGDGDGGRILHAGGKFEGQLGIEELIVGTGMAGAKNGDQQEATGSKPGEQRMAWRGARSGAGEETGHELPFRPFDRGRAEQAAHVPGRRERRIVHCGKNDCSRKQKSQARPGFLRYNWRDYSPAISTASVVSGRSISSTNAIGALSPTRKPIFRMRT